MHKRIWGNPVVGVDQLIKKMRRTSLRTVLDACYLLAVAEQGIKIMTEHDSRARAWLGNQGQSRQTG